MGEQVVAMRVLVDGREIFWRREAILGWEGLALEWDGLDFPEVGPYDLHLRATPRNVQIYLAGAGTVLRQVVRTVPQFLEAIDADSAWDEIWLPHLHPDIPPPGNVVGILKAVPREDLPQRSANNDMVLYVDGREQTFQRSATIRWENVDARLPTLEAGNVLVPDEGVYALAPHPKTYNCSEPIELRLTASKEGLEICVVQQKKPLLAVVRSATDVMGDLDQASDWDRSLNREDHLDQEFPTNDDEEESVADESDLNEDEDGGEACCWVDGYEDCGLDSDVDLLGKDEDFLNDEDDLTKEEFDALSFQEAAACTTPGGPGLVARGIACLRNRDERRAIGLFTRAIENHSDYKQGVVVALYYRGVAYRRLGQLDKGMEDFNRAIDEWSYELWELDPNPSHDPIYDIFRARGDGHYARGHFADAISDYTNALAGCRNAKDLELMYLHRGVAYGETGKWTDAIEDYTEVLTRNGERIDALINRGAAYLNCGDIDQGLQDTQKAHDLDDPYSESHYLIHSNLADGYLKKGELDEAIKHCTEAIELEPAFREPYELRSKAYESKGPQYRKLAETDKRKARKLERKEEGRGQP